MREIIEYLNPAELNYQEWVNVGMALKHEGYSVDVWDSWSRNDHRYHAGECEKKWNTFHGSSAPVTAGTIVQLAIEHGWTPSLGCHELGWDDEISTEGVVIDSSWIESRSFKEPYDWNPVGECRATLSGRLKRHFIIANFSRKKAQPHLNDTVMPLSLHSLSSMPGY